MIIDLTRRIERGMPVYPGDEETGLVQSRQLHTDFYVNHQLSINMHAGTHIDGPMHLTETDMYLNDFPIDRFVGEGCLIDAAGVETIDYKEEYEALIRDGHIVIVHTGWGRLYGEEAYYGEHPVLTDAFAELLVRKKIKMVGLDTPSPDKWPFRVHKRLFENRILIAENLANVDRLIGAPSFEIIALPLNVKADSSVARIIARVSKC